MILRKQALWFTAVLAALASSCGSGDGSGDVVTTDVGPEVAADVFGPDADAVVPPDPVYPDVCLGLSRPSAPACGSIRRQGCCDAAGRVVWCERGALYCIDCTAAGSSGACGFKDVPAFTGYDCGGAGDDPRGLFPATCGLACEPDCDDGRGGARACGDDGCGGRCGDCPPGEWCDDDGACVPAPGGVVHGRLEYEARVPAFDPLAGPTLEEVPVVLPGAGIPVTVADALGAVVGQTVTGQDGAFLVPLARPRVQDDVLVFAAAQAGPAGPMLAVLRPDAGGKASSGTWPTWAWSMALDGDEVGAIRVTLAQGAGALHVFRLVASALDTVVAHLAGGDATQVVPLAVLWAPGVSWDCGYCYASRLPQVPVPGVHLPDSVFLDGHPDGSSAWAVAAVLHEVGHAVLRNHSRSDSPGGSHVVGQLLEPTFAWAEGWTSFFGVSMHSRWLGAPDARLWAVVFGASGARTAFWMDYAAGLGAAATTTPPDLRGGLGQFLDERWVTRALWELWDGDDVDDVGIADDCALGTAVMTRTLASARMVRGDRGFPGADLVDFLDALACDEPGRQAPVLSLVRDALGFPYDGAATCP